MLSLPSPLPFQISWNNLLGGYGIDGSKSDLHYGYYDLSGGPAHGSELVLCVWRAVSVCTLCVLPSEVTDS